MSTPIMPEDIKVGDHIRVTQTHESGAVQTWDDTVNYVDGQHTSTETFLFYREYDENRTYELIERPTPVEPTKVGTLVKMGNGRTAIRTPLDSAFRPQGDLSISPWLYFERRTGSGFEGPAIWLTWDEVLGSFGLGVIEVIEP